MHYLSYLSYIFVKLYFLVNSLTVCFKKANICSDLSTVAEAFGLNIKQVQCSLKGKNYIITDELLTVLKQLERELKERTAQLKTAQERLQTKNEEIAKLNEALVLERSNNLKAENLSLPYFCAFCKPI